MSEVREQVKKLGGPAGLPDKRGFDLPLNIFLF